MEPEKVFFKYSEIGSDIEIKGYFFFAFGEKYKLAGFGIGGIYGIKL